MVAAKLFLIWTDCPLVSPAHNMADIPSCQLHVCSFSSLDWSLARSFDSDLDMMDSWTVLDRHASESIVHAEAVRDSAQLNGPHTHMLFIFMLNYCMLKCHGCSFLLFWCEFPFLCHGGLKCKRNWAPQGRLLGRRSLFLHRDFVAFFQMRIDVFHHIKVVAFLKIIFLTVWIIGQPSDWLSTSQGHLPLC